MIAVIAGTGKAKATCYLLTANYRFGMSPGIARVSPLFWLGPIGISPGMARVKPFLFLIGRGRRAGGERGESWGQESVPGRTVDFDTRFT
jgi:hypothetical protein